MVHSSVGLIASFVICMICGGIASLVLWPPRVRRGADRPAETGAAGAGGARAGAAGAGLTDSPRDIADERELIVRGCMDLADRLRDDRPTLFRKALRDLATVGVTPVIADGHRVDELRHDVIGAKPTTDPTFHRTIASTERLGFTDRGELIRKPCVIVYEGPEILR
ncbi:MAG: hypothetical protein ACQSGP_04765 [Frankia sp.]